MLPFADFLREKAGIQPRYILYYLRWAEMYQTHDAGTPADG
jgi:hypothetical protein